METPFLDAVELFSGVGGWHHAILQAGLPVRIVAAYDSNEKANIAYFETFSHKPVATDLALLSASKLASFAVWLASPPCQPFTQGGSRLDHKDNRSAAILHLIDLIDSGQAMPSLLALENVPLFRESQCRDLLIGALEKQGFSFQEYVVSPDELCQIPNRRLRYYLVASKEAKQFPKVIEPWTPECQIPSLRAFLGNCLASPEEEQDLALPESWTAKKSGFRFHCVSLDRPGSVTQCMTKAYFENKNSGGSYVRRDLNDADPVCESEIEGMRLRFLSRAEARCLMGFPRLKQEWSVGVKSGYRLIGNSLNVTVTAHILKLLFK